MRGRLAALALLLPVVLLSAQGQGILQSNLALGRPVEASGPTWGGLSLAALTDGSPETFCHPLAKSGTLGFYFQIDLGRSYQLDRILIRNRSDGCCPERLSDYAVELYADAGGETGSLNATLHVRADGSDSGTSGVDIVSRTNYPAQNFSGRFIRIVNHNGEPYSPQIGEVEVYGTLPPQIRMFSADDDTLATGESTILRWEIVGGDSATISPEIGEVSGTNGFISVGPDETTSYTLTASNASGSSSATIMIGINVDLLPPIISEFMTDNEGVLQDEDGDASDWIEIANPNPFSLELQGFHLTDNPALQLMWAFPNNRIPANGFLLVYASGKNRTNVGKELHTNFRLSADGEYLGLFTSNRFLVQQFPPDYPEVKEFAGQLPDVSYGVSSNGNHGFFRPATPGSSNGTAFEGVVNEINFSHDRGFYTNAVNLTLATTTPGAIIRYTTNRTEPSESKGLVYTGPIHISETTVLRAIGYKVNWATTPVQTHTFIFPSNVFTSSVMRSSVTSDPRYSGKLNDALFDLPAVSLVTGATLNDTSEVRSSIEWLSRDGQPGFQEHCGTRYFGGAFTSFAKKNLRLYFRSEYGTDKLRYPVFSGHDETLPSVEEFDQLELRGGSHDMVERGFYMANIFTDDTLLEMGQLNPHGRFVHLFLNGTYWGVYHLRERWGAAMHESYLGGSRSDYESINGNWNVGGWADPGSPYDGDGSTWETIKSLRGDYEGLSDLLDVPQYIDYMIMWMFGGSEDEYRAVGPNVPGSGFKFYLNDADGWFCGPWYCAAGNRTGAGSPGRSAGDGPGSIFSMLFKEGHPDYRIVLADRIHQALFHSGALTPSRNAARLERRTSEIERAFILESARWNYLSPSDWAARRNHSLNVWLPSRTSEVLDDFRRAGFYPDLDAPVLIPHGGPITPGYQLSFQEPSRGTIYYTLDGTDPRLTGGAISPAAHVFSSESVKEIVVPPGSRWRWFTDGTGLGSSAILVGHAGWSALDWKHLDFNDSFWSEAAAELGYGEGDEATILPFGPDSSRKWTTSYFRHRFEVSDPAEISSALIRLKRDDGAIVYLNGREVIRTAIGTGSVNGTTLSEPVADDGKTFNEFLLSPSFLIPGTNILAVELHQSTLNTTDASFDLELSVNRKNQEPGGNALPILNQNTVIKARGKDGAEWSALSEVFYQADAVPVNSGDIVISELNFDLTGAGVEFVEVMNISEHAINLRGSSFTEGIRFHFPSHRDTLVAPGQRLVLVEDLFRFQQLYGNKVPVVGIFDGKLANEGERITFSTSTNTVFTTVYGTASPWPTPNQEVGATLVLAHPHLGMDHPEAWRVGITGTPGTSNSTTFTGEPAEDLDEDGMPALVEYVLGTSDLDPGSGPGTIQAFVDENRSLGITFPRFLPADDVQLQCDFSTDLVVWARASLLESAVIEGELARETWGIPSVGHSALFLRLTVNRK